MSQEQIDEKSAYETGTHAKGSQIEGEIHIDNDVIAELAKRTVLGISNIQLANMGIASKFGIGRKAGDGIRVSKEEGKIPVVSVEIFIVVKYGQRIPDLAWDVQERVKGNLERYTGYVVKAVNVNVQGIYLEDSPVVSEKEAQKNRGSQEVLRGGRGFRRLSRLAFCS
jgi:uncharacterized alkaline shock family protein YloU